MLEEISDPIAIERDREDTPEEIQYWHIYLSEIEQNKSDGKTAELESWKSQGIYTEVENNNQTCVSTRWVKSKKSLEGKPITKARLCATGFEEVQDFRTDSPCCSRIGIQLALSVLTLYKWQLKSVDVKILSSKEKRSRVKPIYDYQKKPTPTKSGSFRNKSMV